MMRMQLTTSRSNAHWHVCFVTGRCVYVTTTLLIVTALLAGNAFAESADACYLGYPDCGIDGDMLIGRVQIPYATLRTYYCLLHWNAGQEGGGYCGLQRGGFGSAGEIFKHFHYSIWNSASSPDSIRTIYRDEMTYIDPFGGEGTGKKCLWPFEWVDGDWYTLATRIWHQGGETRFGFWVRDEQSLRWYHVVSLGYPVDDVWFYGCTGAFLEDFGQSAEEERRMHSRGGWKRSTQLAWVPYDSVRFGSAGTHGAHNGGEEDDYCFMEAGGTIEPEISDGTWLHLPNHPPIPELGTPGIDNVTAFLDAEVESVQVTWYLSELSSPQYEYRVSVVKNADRPALVQQRYSDTSPSTRSIKFSSAEIDTATTTIGVSIVDIFGNSSSAVYTSVVTPVRRKSWGGLKDRFRRR